MRPRLLNRSAGTRQRAPSGNARPQETRCGKRSIKALPIPSRHCAPFARIGRALARLHSATLPVSANRSTSFWIHETQLRAKKIGRVLPHLANRAQSLVNQLERSAAELPPARQALIHGDFHPDQVWLAEDRVVFFDFDEFAIGNPMEDLAEFVVKFEQGRDVQPQARARRASQIKFLIEGYRERAPQWFDAAWLQWHCAVQTLLQASRAFIYQQPGWREQLESRLDASQALASTAVFEVAAW